MALILCLETATKMCSVAISRDGESLAFKEKGGAYSHAENLTVFVEEVLSEAHVAINELDAIAVGKGPGSYTGLRIGVATAKGLCYSLGKPLIGISTLEAMCNQEIVDESAVLKPHYCPMIDARRMEVYCAIYNSNRQNVKPIAAEIIDEHSFADVLQQNKIVFFGDGAEKCKESLKGNPNAIFVDEIEPSAANMAQLAENAYAQKKFEDVAYFEPFYLKDFVATVPKKLV